MIGVMARQYEEYQNLNFSAEVSIQGLNQQFLILSAFREKYFFISPVLQNCLSCILR